MTMPQNKQPRLLRKKEVQDRLRIKRTALDAAIARGDFPAPTKVFPGGRVVAWLEDVIEDYIARRFAAHKKGKR